MDVIQSIHRLESLRDEWNALADLAERPLLRHEWFASCARTLHEEGDLRIAIVRSNGRLVAAAPLVRSRMHGVGRLEFIGMSSLHEPCGLLFSSEDALVELVRSLVGLGMTLDLQRLDADSAVCRIVPALIRRPGLVLNRKQNPSLSIPIRSRWEDYLKTLSSHVSKNIPRLKARVSKTARVRMELHAPPPEEVDRLLETVMAVEGSGWKGRRGSSISLRPKMRAFFTEYARRAAAAGHLRVALLWFGDRVAAVELSVEAYRRIWQLKIGYEDSLSRDYPGLQLLMETIRSAFERGLEGYEFLGSAASWEEQWRPEARSHCSIRAYPATVAGLGGLAVDAIQFAEGRLSRRFLRAVGSGARASGAAG